MNRSPQYQGPIWPLISVGSCWVWDKGKVRSCQFILSRNITHIYVHILHISTDALRSLRKSVPAFLFAKNQTSLGSRLPRCRGNYPICSVRPRASCRCARCRSFPGRALSWIWRRGRRCVGGVFEWRRRWDGHVRRESGGIGYLLNVVVR